jgi:PTS system mannitol-specific IIC component
MVMPNIGAFVAWGLITSLFIPTGWMPNEHLAKLVGPMITYLLPILIGYTGGRLVGGDRGAVVGAIATAGIVVGASIPMFLGAMLVGPLGGWAIKKFDAAVDGKVTSGFEMLVNNFSAGIIGMILALLAYLVIGPVVASLSAVLGQGVDSLVQLGVLPLVSILVEPAKVLFLNNTINHGVFTPLGTQQALEHGKSLVFLIEANPGPGLGLLLAYMVFGRGTARQSAPAAAIIHFLGGIHEIYFPFVLMKPRLIIAMILGGMTGVFTLSILGGGLRAPASPGSIFAVLLMAPGSAMVGVVCSVVAACAVTFAVASILLKTDTSEETDLDEASRRVQGMKREAKGFAPAAQPAVRGAVSSIIVACDAGMGSSAMGATMLRKKLDAAGLKDIRCTNTAINALPPTVDIVVTHKDLTERARRAAPQATHISVTNFLDSTTYDRLVADLMASTPANNAVATSQSIPSDGKLAIGQDCVFLGLSAATKEEAIRLAGEKLLAAGCIRPAYVDAMLTREKVVSTYIGQSLAMPHGTNEARGDVLKTGVVICQYPDGVWFGPDQGNVAHLVVGLAAKGDEHMGVISALARIFENPKIVAHLATTKNKADLLRVLELA